MCMCYVCVCVCGFNVQEIANNALMQFQILDFPGGYRFDDKGRDRSDTDRDRVKPEPSKVFQRPGALVFVIDGQVSSVII